MKKLYLSLLLAAIGTVSEAAVVAVDLNQDGSFEAFSDAAHGLLWTTGKQVGLANNFASAEYSATHFANEGVRWRLPTVAEFRQLYETQGHLSNGKMIYGGAFDFYQNYYWTSDAANTDSHVAFAVNSALGSASQTHTFQNFRPSLGVIAVSSVPEPQTYAALIAGLGVVAGVVRRRKQKSEHSALTN